MLGRLARGAYMLMLVVMIAVWALSLGKTESSAPSSTQPVERWYS
jgi:hypothetical protein